MTRLHHLRLTSLRLLACALLLSPFAVCAEEIVFVNDASPYCPFTVCEDGKDGYVTDIVNAIYKDAGYSVRILNVPWNRAIAMVKDGSALGIINIAKKTAPALIFPHAEVARYNAVFFTRKSNPWVYNGLDSLKGRRLGLIKNYSYGENSPPLASFLKNSADSVDWFGGLNPLADIFRAIDSGSVDATVEDLAVGNYVLKKAGEADKFKVAGYVAKSEPVIGYVAFTNKNFKSQHLADVFDQGIVKLRKSGRLKTILADYGLTGWVQLM